MSSRIGYLFYRNPLAWQYYWIWLTNIILVSLLKGEHGYGWSIDLAGHNFIQKANTVKNNFVHHFSISMPEF